MKVTKREKINSQKGFTLLEVILVMMFTGLSFVAIYGLFSSTIKHDTESRYEVIAANLAQEGIEIIRNRRDENILNGELIDHGIAGSCNPVINGGNFSCGGANICIMGDRYQPCSDLNTTFKRECIIGASDTDGVSGDDTLDVTCTVSWKSFVLKDNAERKMTTRAVMNDWFD